MIMMKLSNKLLGTSKFKCTIDYYHTFETAFRHYIQHLRYKNLKTF